MPKGPGPVASAFEKAIAGLKKPDAQSLGNLSGLLVTMAAATDDGFHMLVGYAIGATADTFGALQNLQTLNPELGEFLRETAHKLSTALQRLQPHLAGDNPDSKNVLDALGDIAKVTFELNQKAQQLQAMPRIGGED